MKTQFLFVILGLCAGMLIPVQACTNAAVLAYALVSRAPVPDSAQLRSAPFYSYLGGLIIAFYVISITIITPRLGVATSIGLIITGQIIAAVTIDHFGLFSIAVRQIDVRRLAGTLCMIVGIYLVMKKR